MSNLSPASTTVEADAVNPIQSRRCDEIDGPPCDPLLTDPLAILGDTERWPKHLCSIVASNSTYAWAEGYLARISRYAPAARIEILGWATSWPIPIGIEAVADMSAICEWRYVPTLLEPVLPFSGGEHAAIILPLNGASSNATFFGLGEAAAEPDDDKVLSKMWLSAVRVHARRWLVSHSPGVAPGLVLARGINTRARESRYLISGASPHDPEAQKRDMRAAQWWSTMSGRRIRGRPPGTGKIRSREQIIAAYESLSDHLTGQPPDQYDVAYELGVNVSTLRTSLKRFGMVWPINLKD